VLTIALASALAGGVVLGILAYLIRALPALRQLDRAVAGWGYDHRSPLSSDGLRTLTDLGTFQVVVALAVLVTVVDLVHTRNRGSIAFLIVVMAGTELLTTGVKDLVDRARPALVPQAAALGPSFPSGHSATAASFYAAAALILGRRLGPRARRALGAGAVGVAVAVAGSRVLLELHWLSDVIGGLALEWGWFALCASVSAAYCSGRLPLSTRQPPSRRGGAPRTAPSALDGSSRPSRGANQPGRRCSPEAQ
jgi:undecaprenyl-diphosphatase